MGRLVGIVNKMEDNVVESVVEKKKRKGSKNKKKSWRKNTDIADVEEHLEDLRREERTGGAVNEVEDDQLFFVDKETEKDTLKSKRKVDASDHDEDEEEYVPKKQKFMQK